MKRIFIILISICGFCLHLNAQQLPIYSQYSMNKFLLNPAAAGLEGYTAFNLTAREQWLGFEDSPKTHAISVQSRILKNSFIRSGASLRKKRRWGTRSGNVGYGFYMFNDKNGLLDRTGLQGTYSYHIKMGPSQMSFGLSLMTYQFKVNRQEAQFSSELFDPVFNDKPVLYVPDANIGTFYSHPDFYAGFAASQLFQNQLQFNDIGDGEYAIVRHYTLVGGYKYKINRDLVFEPSVLFKYPEGLTPQLDINTQLTFKDDYWGGMSYRTGNAIILFMGVRFDMVYFGYAFDYTLQSIRKHTFGSHEAMIAVKFGDNARRYRWLNRY